MLTRRSTLAFIAVSLSLVASSAWADAAGFSAQALAAAQADNKSVLVEVTAPWCPTCKAQKAVLDTLLSEPRFATMTKLSLDFDSQQAEMKSLKANTQSTLIVYKGKTEVGRVVGVTKKAEIEALLAKAL